MTLALLLALPTAHAFCGTFVGGVDDTLTNHTSQVILAQDGRHTRLTLSVDYAGDASQFALLLPVPDIVHASDVSTPDQALVDAVQAYGSPRAVEYTCENALPFSLSCSPFGCSSSGDTAAWGDYGTTNTDETVQVVESFDVNGYSLVVLDAEQSSGLWSWLDENGYAVPAGGEEILQEYIDQGLYFLAVKIDMNELGVVSWLPPLSISYDDSHFSLPIRIGTISADGEQEVIINTITAEDNGQVGVANYREITQDTDCMVDWGADFSTWYADRIAARFAEGAGWIREHSWPVYKRVVTEASGYHCDPCEPTVSETGDFSLEQLRALGADGDDLHLSRIRMRYTPEEATEDVTLYFDGIVDVKAQARFIQYKPELETLYPLCDVGWAEDPGSCPENTAPSMAMLLTPFGLLLGGAWATRRRA